MTTLALFLAGLDETTVAKTIGGSENGFSNVISLFTFVFAVVAVFTLLKPNSIRDIECPMQRLSWAHDQTGNLAI